MAWPPGSFLIESGKVLYYIIIAYYNFENVLIIFKNPIFNECSTLFDLIIII